MPDTSIYPAAAAARDRFVLERRGSRPSHDPWRDQGVMVEDERAPDGSTARIATVFLTGRECPWRCTMCDLWRYTTATDTPPGAIAAQVASARDRLREAGDRVNGIKLYNAGSFFDPRAVPETDYDGVADAVAGLPLVVVESHPALVGPRLDQLMSSLARHAAAGASAPQLEVAMGLETAHPEALERLNKRFTLEGFARAAGALADRGVALRVFLLISPPFVPLAEQDSWLRRSLDAAFDCGATVVSLVPTRPGNGAVEALAASGWFNAPRLDGIERSFALGLAHAADRGRIFLDLWDLDRFATCRECLAPRRARLHSMNLTQRLATPHVCAAACQGGLH